MTDEKTTREKPAKIQYKASKKPATNQQKRIEINSHTILTTELKVPLGYGTPMNILLFILCKKSASTFDKKIVKFAWESHWIMRLLTFYFHGTLDPIRYSFCKRFEKNCQNLRKRDFLLFTFAIIKNGLSEANFWILGIKIILPHSSPRNSVYSKFLSPKCKTDFKRTLPKQKILKFTEYKVVQIKQ